MIPGKEKAFDRRVPERNSAKRGTEKAGILRSRRAVGGCPDKSVMRCSAGGDARAEIQLFLRRVKPTFVSRPEIRSPCRVVPGGAISLSCESVPECRTRSPVPYPSSDPHPPADPTCSHMVAAKAVRFNYLVRCDQPGKVAGRFGVALRKH